MARGREGAAPKVVRGYRHFRLYLKAPYLPVGLELEFDY